MAQRPLRLEAYVTIFQDGQLTHSMLYTILVTVLFTVIGMVITICAAYPLSRRRLKGRNFFSLMISVHAVLLRRA